MNSAITITDSDYNLAHPLNFPKKKCDTESLPDQIGPDSHALIFNISTRHVRLQRRWYFQTNTHANEGRRPYWKRPEVFVSGAESMKRWRIVVLS